MAREEKRRSIRDRVRQDAQDAAQGGGGSTIRLPEGMDWFKTEKGTMEIDVVPYEVKSKVNDKADPGDLFYRREFMVHRDIGAEKKQYICPRSVKQPCPICEYRAELQKDTRADEELVKALKPSRRDLYYVDPDGKGKKFQVLEVSNWNFTKKLLEEIREGDEDWAGFADLERGYTLKVRFSEESLGKNKYLEATRIDFMSRENYPESILDHLPDMDELLVVLPYEKLNKIFLELEDDPGEPAEEPRRGRSTRDDRDDVPPPEDEPPVSQRGRQEPPAEEQPRSRRGRQEAHDDLPPAEDPSPRSRRGRDADPEPAQEAAPRGRRGRQEEPPANDNPCPSGYEFGVDADKHDECQTCPKWEACMDERDALEAASKAGGRRR